MSEFCNSCHKPFPDFRALALHIQSKKKGHRKGKIWAARYLTNVKYLDEKVSRQNRPERQPVSEELKETRQSLIRELSGEVHTVLAVCPICKKGHTERVESEYLDSPTTWKSETGKPMIICGNCKRERG